MARTYLTFGDLDGKIDMLRVECTKCGRKGRYSVVKLIERYGRRANLTKWLSDVRGDCPKRETTILAERCDVRCPDLARVL